MLKSVKALMGAAVISLFLGFGAQGVYAEGNQVGIVNADALNVREAPNTTAAVVTQLYSDEQVSILETGDGWYKISSGDLAGWVKADFITMGEANTATISAENVNVRTGPSTTSDIVIVVTEGEKVTVLGQSDDWYNVKFSSGVSGWVHGDLISVSGSQASRGESLGKRIVSFANKYQGVKYVYGGSSSNGFDCSGFTKYVYGNLGISLERVAADQASQGTKVSKSGLQVGDLVFFDTDGGHNYINHVGIYIGSGQFIHASSGSGKVVTSTLAEGFYANNYMTARALTR